MEWKKDEFLITDNQSAADIDFVHTSLNSTYWAENRTREVVEKSLEKSVLLSLFKGEEQIGFTRIVSDEATFAWISDVFVHPDHRGKGLGVWLMECTMAHPVMDVTLQILATKDAQGLYEKFGFQRREMMFRRKA
ncbi:MAG: GNAT family N-acetyltransferase [Anaerolineales bacterium]|jgi:GNAT superfamily N-acetyltransferase